VPDEPGEGRHHPRERPPLPAALRAAHAGGDPRGRRGRRGVGLLPAAGARDGNAVGPERAGRAPDPSGHRRGRPGWRRLERGPLATPTVSPPSSHRSTCRRWPVRLPSRTGWSSRTQA
jgi:hypothetical protein